MAATTNPGYASFLIRWWEPEGGDSRVKIEHIQSGATTGVASLEDTLAWMRELMGLGDGPDTGSHASTNDDEISAMGHDDTNDTVIAREGEGR